MLSNYPRLEKFWTLKDSKHLHIHPTDTEKNELSQREKIMLTFFVSVWSGGSQDFDFIYSARALENVDKKIIANWLMDPIVPWSDQPHSFRSD